jgi:hypothetical protein
MDRYGLGLANISISSATFCCFSFRLFMIFLTMPFYFPGAVGLCYQRACVLSGTATLRYWLLVIPIAFGCGLDRGCLTAWRILTMFGGWGTERLARRFGVFGSLIIGSSSLGVDLGWHMGYHDPWSGDHHIQRNRTNFGGYVWIWHNYLHMA